MCYYEMCYQEPSKIGGDSDPVLSHKFNTNHQIPINAVHQSLDYITICPGHATDIAQHFPDSIQWPVAELR